MSRVWTLELTLDELGDWLQTRSDALLATFRQEALSVVDDLERQVSDIRRNADRLTAANLDADEAEVRYASRLSEKIISSLPKMEVPKKLEFEVVENIHETTVRALTVITEAGRTYIPRLSKHYKPAVGELDYLLKKIAASLTKLAMVLQRHRPRAQALASLRSDIESLQQLARRRNEALNAKDVHSKRLNQLEVEFARLSAEGESKRKQTAFQELLEADRRIQSIESQLTQLLSPISKPLRKIQKLVAEGRMTLRRPSVQVLETVIDEPAQLLRPFDLPSVVTLLEDTKNVLGKGVVKLDKRKEKRALEALSGALEGKLHQLRAQYAEALAARNSLEEKFGTAQISRELRELEASHKACSRELAAVRDEYTKIGQRLDLLESEIEERTLLLEKEIEKTTKDHISVRD